MYIYIYFFFLTLCNIYIYIQLHGEVPQNLTVYYYRGLKLWPTPSWANSVSLASIKTIQHGGGLFEIPKI